MSEPRHSIYPKLAFLFVVLFLTLIAVGLWAHRRWPERFFYDPIVTDSPYYRKHAILETPDHPYRDLTLYHGIGPAIDNARNADVLILGNSTARDAFNHDEVQKAERRSGIRFFNLSTGGSSCFYQLEIVERNHLKPKVVLLNCFDNFFLNLKPPQQETVNTTRWQALMMIEEKWGSLILRHWFQSVFPKPLMFNKGAGKFLYDLFSVDDGCIEPECARTEGVLYPLDRPDFPVKDEALELAREMKRRLDEQKIKLILIYVPSNSRPQNVRDLAKILNVPCVTACPATLHTLDGKHLFWKENAEYTRQFFKALLRMPQFRSMVPVSSGSIQ